MGIELLLDMAVSEYGTRVAIGSRDGGLTFDGMSRMARGAAALIAESKASHLAAVGVIGPMLPIGLFGAAMAGVPFVPLNYRLAAAQLEELLATLDDPLVIVDEDFLATLGSRSRHLLATTNFLSAVETAPIVEPVGTDDDASAVLLFTSGTTSKPKGVILTHGNLISYVTQTVEFGSASTEECQLIAVPPYHVAGVGSALTSTFSCRRVVHRAQFDPADWLDTVRDEAVTTAMVVPTMLARVTAYLDGASGNVPSLRSLAYGGARMPRPLLERALLAFPDVDFTNAYGLTETSSTIAVLGPDDHRAAVTSDNPAVTARLDSVGTAVPGIEISVRNEKGHVVALGEVGEVFVRGPQVSGIYAGSGSALVEGGWFPTRDNGWLDQAGYLFIVGRGDDTIIRGGENIAPSEIEDVLHRHPEVRDCAVIGLPDEEWGERIAAVVVRERGATVTTEQVRAYVRGRLRGSRTPDDVFFVDTLPYTTTGKLLRRELASTVVNP